MDSIVCLGQPGGMSGLVSLFPCQRQLLLGETGRRHLVQRHVDERVFGLCQQHFADGDRRRAKVGIEQVLLHLDHRSGSRSHNFSK